MDRIFEIGDISLDLKYLKFINIGLKFVPTFNKIDLYYFIFNFYNSLHKLNNNIIFSTKNNTNPTNTNNSNDKYHILPYLNKNFPTKTPFIYTHINTNQFYKEFFNNILKNYSRNLTKYPTDFKFFSNLLKTIKNKNIIIAPCDKNVGIALFESSIYHHLSITHLKDTKTYMPLTYNPHHELYNQTKTLLTDLEKSPHISTKLAAKLLNTIKNKKLPKFRALPKLHKTKFDIRPLINCANSTTSPLSKTIDFILKPIMAKHLTYLKDSQHLIQKIHNLNLQPNTELLTADFSSLYTNIPIDQFIIIISDMIRDYPDLDKIHFSPTHTII